MAIARALVSDPDLILADEPTGNLDSASAREILDLLSELHASGRTVVLITHDAGVAESADRAIHILDGNILSDETRRPVDNRGIPMSWIETMRTGLEAVVTHRLRSSLTILGILIGIAAVILTVGLGEGAQAQVTSEVSSLGANLLIVSPGSTTSGSGVRGGLGSASHLDHGRCQRPLVQDGRTRHQGGGADHVERRRS